MSLLPIIPLKGILVLIIKQNSKSFTSIFCLLRTFKGTLKCVCLRFLPICYLFFFVFVFFIGELSKLVHYGALMFSDAVLLFLNFILDCFIGGNQNQNNTINLQQFDSFHPIKMSVYLY